MEPVASGQWCGLAQVQRCQSSSGKGSHQTPAEISNMTHYLASVVLFKLGEVEMIFVGSH
jgi:hypothetical protein